MTASIFFASVLVTAISAFFLALYAWSKRSVPGSGAFEWLQVCVCLLAVTETLSMLAGTASQALFWFKLRYPAAAAIGVFWMLFALAYGGLTKGVPRRLMAGLLGVPVLTQALMWTNGFHGLWLRQEAVFHKAGPFWIAETWTRIPAAGFILHSLYGLILIAAGAAVIIFSVWRRRSIYKAQGVLISAVALVAIALSIIPSFGLIRETEFNSFVPGMGLCSILYAVAIFRFRFLEEAPAAEPASIPAVIQAPVTGSLPTFIIIFTIMGAGIGAGGFLSYRDYEARFRAQVESQLTSIARLKLDELTDWHHDRMADAGAFFKNRAFSALVERLVKEPGEQDVRSMAQTWLDRVLDTRNYDRISLHETGGSVIISSPQRDEVATDHIKDDCERTLEKGEITFLDLHRDKTGGPERMAVLVPIYSNAEGSPMAILCLRIDPKRYLYPFISQWPVPSESAETLLVRR